ncbi:MAG TPA: SGNH/GDSL hydrolase family protein [Vicinamibacterales bacterium]|nr:SGNH/GDSL hydrolase family protein [Vicinamibacterales bacterium]
MRPRARRLLLFGLILLGWFGVFEAGLRHWGSSEAAPAFQGLFTGDPVIGYRLRPGTRTRFATAEFDTEISINNAGVRDDEDIGPKAPGEKRIVVLGDSLVLSVQVSFPTTFTEQMERRLDERRAPGDASTYRVINAGVQGYGPVEELLFFQTRIAQLQPDVVLVAVFVGNDAEEALTSQVKLASGRPATERLRESIVTALRRLVRRSMVLQVLRLRIVTATDRFRGTAGPPEPPLQTYAANPAPRIARGIAFTRDAVAGIAAEAGRAGARTGIILMPARLQLDDGDYGRYRAIIAEAGGELVRHAATERFAKALGELRLPMIDLLPPLRAALPGPDLFFQENVHLTPRGHAVVGETLARFVREQSLLVR